MLGSIVKGILRPRRLTGAQFFASAPGGIGRVFLCFLEMCDFGQDSEHWESNNDVKLESHVLIRYTGALGQRHFSRATNLTTVRSAAEHYGRAGESGVVCWR